MIYGISWELTTLNIVLNKVRERIKMNIKNKGVLYFLIFDIIIILSGCALNRSLPSTEDYFSFSSESET